MNSKKKIDPLVSFWAADFPIEIGLLGPEVEDEEGDEDGEDGEEERLRRLGEEDELAEKIEELRGR